MRRTRAAAAGQLRRADGCGAAGGTRRAGARRAASGEGGRRRLNRVSSSLVEARRELCNVSRRVRTAVPGFATKTPIQHLRRRLCEHKVFTQTRYTMPRCYFIIIVGCESLPLTVFSLLQSRLALFLSQK